MNTEALERLIEAVEAGTCPLGKVEACIPKWSSLVMASFDGSLDAAQALHDALVPMWSVDDLSQNGRLVGDPWGIRIEKWNGSVGGAVATAQAGWGGFNGKDMYAYYTPARCWLLAILRAKLAEVAA